ncbi:Calcium permeable stress-gated cation channel 1 [Hyphodiscus hymeniophilus]|uniref:Calcium permeable stress-gated cation channel 1 n=1 Tax=Hyphodiscus hymeniophilus TaxID=353542 RepID=A0A9P7AZL6_9HELO|nr:Calcium permeable stress-gated cation channel 1 [Hyphodiscus hymeniophilus]
MSAASANSSDGRVCKGYDPTDPTNSNQNIYVQLVLSLALGLSAFIGFCLLRPRWKGLYAARKRQSDAAVSLPELPDSFFGWIPVLYRVTEQQVLDSAGLDAYVLLSFFRMSIKLFAAMFLITCAILVPVNKKFAYLPTLGNNTDPRDPPESYQQFAFKADDWLSAIDVQKGKNGNLPRSNYLWAYLVFTWIYTALIIYFMRRETLRVIQVRQDYLGSQSTITDRTIRLSGVPQELRSEEKITEFLEKLEIGKVDSVTIVRNWKTLDDLMNERMYVLRKLEEAWTVHLGRRKTKTTKPHSVAPTSDSSNEDGNEEVEADEDDNLLGESHITAYEKPRPTTRLWYGFMNLQSRKVDAIDYFEEKLRSLDDKIKDARKKEYKATPTAFITMDSIPACQMAVQALLDPSPGEMQANLAPAPSDVVWQNTYIPRSSRMLRSWIITLFILVLTVFWLIPVIALAGLLNICTIRQVWPQLADVLESHEILKSLVQTALPTLVVSLLNLAVPFFYDYLANQQGMISQGDVELSVISKNFFFTFFNVFLVFTVFGTASNFWPTLRDTLRDSFRDTTTLAFLLATIGLFPFRLLEFGSVTLYPIMLMGSKTPRDYAELVQPPLFKYGFYLPTAILVFILCIVYSILPAGYMVLFFGLIYFVFGYYTYKYQLLYAMDHPQHATGGAWPMICYRIMVGMGVFQLLMAGVIALEKQFTAAALVVPLIPITIWYSYYFSRTYEPLTKFIALRSIRRESNADVNLIGEDVNGERPTGIRRRRSTTIDESREKGLKFVNPNLVKPLEKIWINRGSEPDSNGDSIEPSPQTQHEESAASSKCENNISKLIILRNEFTMPTLSYHSTTFESASTQEANDTTSSQIFLSRGVAGSDSDPSTPLNGSSVVVSSTFESSSRHILSLGDASRHANVERLFRASTVTDDSKEGSCGFFIQNARRSRYLTSTDGGSADLPHETRHSTTPMASSEFSEEPEGIHSEAPLYTPKVIDKDRGKGKEVERGRSLEKGPKYPNPLVRADSWRLPSTTAIELNARPISKRPSRSSTFFENPSDPCAVLDDKMLEPCPDTMLRRGGWSSSIPRSLQKNRPKLQYASKDQDTVNEEWQMSKRLSRECALGSNWSGEGLCNTSNSPFVQTSTTDFTDVAVHYPGLNSSGTIFTVSCCGKFLMAANGCLIYVYELNKTHDGSDTDEPGPLRPVTSILCPRRVLACSMDTSSHRYAVAVLLDDRMGLVCEISPYNVAASSRFASQSEQPGFGKPESSENDRTSLLDHISLNTSGSNSRLTRPSSEPPFVFPGIAATPPLGPALVPDESAWQDMYSSTSHGAARTKGPNSTRSSNSVHTVSPRSRTQSIILPRIESKSMPIENGPRSLYRGLCSDDDPPRSVAICPQRRCVAFGCSAGIELHWVDALTGQDLNRWFPLTAPSDYLFFLPPRKRVDSAKKLRLISSAARPGERAAIGDRAFGWRTNNSPFWKTLGRASQAVDDEEIASQVQGMGSRLRSEVRMRGLRGREDYCDHYRAIPLSDGYHILFTDPSTGLLCLGTDAPVGGPTKLLRKIWFQGPTGEGNPIAYASGPDLTYGVRVVAAFGTGLEQSIWFFSVPGDVFAADNQNYPTIPKSSSLKSGTDWEGQNLEWLKWAPDDGLQEWLKQSQDPAPGLVPRNVWPVKIKGQKIGKLRNLVDLAIDSGPSMNIWAFSNEGVAKVWQIDDGRLDGFVTERRVSRDGTIRMVDRDGDIEMSDAPRLSSTSPEILVASLSLDVKSPNVEMSDGPSPPSTAGDYALPLSHTQESFDGTASFALSSAAVFTTRAERRYGFHRSMSRVNYDAGSDILMEDLQGSETEDMSRGLFDEVALAQAGNLVYKTFHRSESLYLRHGEDFVEHLTGVARIDIEIR